MNFDDQKQIFERLYEGVDGPHISQVGRRSMTSESAKHLIYGEFSFDELATIFERPEIRKDMRSSHVFCDLGSGTGRILVGMSLLYPYLSSFVGLELVKTLSDTAKRVRKDFYKIEKKAANRIRLVNDNFFNVDFSQRSLDLDVVFMHYPMHDAEDLYLKLEDKMRAELKSGAIIVSGIRKLADTDSFPQIANPYKIRCHYGYATMYYHKKI
ncbi:MAG: hypothetical protein LBB18_02525 [Puniceicoccales bacterium]|jgi:SAM-dependent methyltransferase|nr:hypothetical protein [Puniceicoccales bacterium]